MKIKALTLMTLVAVLLSACANAEGVSLDDTSWELSAISKHRPIAGSTITIVFEDGRVSGHSGCNSYGGEYKITGNKIEIGMLMSTMMACADSDRMEQETDFMQKLGQAQRVELVDGQLQIFWSEHEALTFVAAK